MIAWWLTLVLAWAADDGLTPRVEDVDHAMVRAGELMLKARAQTNLLAEAQNAFVQDGCVARRCSVERGVALVLDSRDAGHRSRDLIQSARAELLRAQRWAAFAAVQPLFDDVRRARLVTLGEAVDEQVRAWEARAAWQVAYIEPWARTYRYRIEHACLPAAEP